MILYSQEIILVAKMEVTFSK